MAEELAVVLPERAEKNLAAWLSGWLWSYTESRHKPRSHFKEMADALAKSLMQDVVAEWQVPPPAETTPATPDDDTVERVAAAIKAEDVLRGFNTRGEWYVRFAKAAVAAMPQPPTQLAASPSRSNTEAVSVAASNVGRLEQLTAERDEAQTRINTALELIPIGVCGTNKELLAALSGKPVAGVRDQELTVAPASSSALAVGFDEKCPKRADGMHCVHWYDDLGPCCGCGDDPSSGCRCPDRGGSGRIDSQCPLHGELEPSRSAITDEREAEV